MRRQVNPQVWKTKILDEFRDTFPNSEALEALAQYEIDFESLYQRLRLLAPLLLIPQQEEHWAFILLASKRQSESFRRTVEKDLNKVDSCGNTAMHYLALRGDAQFINLENIKVLNHHGHSLFHCAILGREIALREEVRQNPLAPFRRDLRERVCYDDQGIVYRELTQAWLDAVERILEKDPEAAKLTTAIRWTALHFAVIANDLSLIQFLMRDCGVDPLIKDTLDGMAPLHLAANLGATKMLKFFINDCGMNALEKTSPRRHYGSPQSILELAQESKNQECIDFCNAAMERAKATQQPNAVLLQANQPPLPSAPSASDAPDFPAPVQMGANQVGLFRLPPDNPALDSEYFAPPKAPGAPQ